MLLLFLEKLSVCYVTTALHDSVDYGMWGILRDNVYKTASPIWTA